METEKQLLGALLDLTAEQQQAAAAVLSKLERQAQAFDTVIQRSWRACWDGGRSGGSAARSRGLTRISPSLSSRPPSWRSATPGSSWRSATDACACMRRATRAEIIELIGPHLGTQTTVRRW